MEISASFLFPILRVHGTIKLYLTMRGASAMAIRVRKIGKFYSGIIMKNVVLFMAFGLMSVCFAETGWFPNAEIYQIAGMIYQVLIPVMIGYAAGKKSGDDIGGVAGALASIGFVAGDSISAIMGVMIIAPAAGYIAAMAYRIIREKAWPGFEMLVKNVVIAIIGTMAALFAYFIVTPILAVGTHGLNQFVDILIRNQMLPFIGLFIEPAKVFFLNNGLNHGILIPLGMEQLQQTGQSVLFLLETNPGPGLGILIAYYIKKEKERRNFTSCMVIHFLGGIHEVYFPYVLMNLRLLIAVIAGGVTGSFIFILTGTGLAGPVSPGSFLTILLMSGRSSLPGIIIGITASAAVTTVIALFLLKRDTGEEEREAAGMDELSDDVYNMEETAIRKIYFVCDAGVGSSAMGAALLRRKLREVGIVGITILPASIDEIPKDADLIICHESFQQMIESEQQTEVYAVDELVQMEEYEPLIRRLQQSEAKNASNGGELL